MLIKLERFAPSLITSQNVNSSLANCINILEGQLHDQANITNIANVITFTENLLELIVLLMRK